jgi:hypothetical protein
LLVLGILILGVLQDVLFFQDSTQSLSDFLTTHGAKIFQLFLQLFEPFWSQEGRLCGHAFLT